MPGCMHMLDWRNFHPIRECGGDGAEFYHGHKRCCKLAWQCTRLKNFQWVSLLPDSSDRPSLRLLFWWWWLSLPLLSPYSIYQSKGTTWGKIRSDSHKNPQCSCIERMFGILKKRFSILAAPLRNASGERARDQSSGKRPSTRTPRKHSIR